MAGRLASSVGKIQFFSVQYTLEEINCLHEEKLEPVARKSLGGWVEVGEDGRSYDFLAGGRYFWTLNICALV